MKRIIIAALVCVVLSLIPLQPTEITLNILYGLIGVLFFSSDEPYYCF
jgi:hypothetical protein